MCGRRRSRSGGGAYGVVVESVNVSVLLYVPVRRASVEPIACWNCRDTWSLDAGPVYVSRLSGVAAEPTGAYVVAVLAAFRARAWSGCGSENVPLTRWPVFVLLVSATLRVASPAVEITFAVVEASYDWGTPAANGGKFAAGPTESARLAGTVPFTVPFTSVCRTL